MGTVECYIFNVYGSFISRLKEWCSSIPNIKQQKGEEDSRQGGGHACSESKIPYDAYFRRMYDQNIELRLNGCPTYESFNTFAFLTVSVVSSILVQTHYWPFLMFILFFIFFVILYLALRRETSRFQFNTFSIRMISHVILICLCQPLIWKSEKSMIFSWTMKKI